MGDGGASFWRFGARRLLETVIVLWASATLFFLAARILPGDPIRAMFGFEWPPPGALEELYRHFHLDRPLSEQYWRYLWDLLHLDFGVSFQMNGPITPVVLASLVVSLKLLLIAGVGQTLLGVAGGVWSRRTRRRTVRHATRLSVLVAASVPILVTAMVARVLLVDAWRLIPAQVPASGWLYYLVPGGILALVFAAHVALVTDEALAETGRAPFVQAAHGRGLPPGRITWRHVLRPSLPPVITLIGTNLAQVVTALLVVETVFNVPGLGLLTYNAIRARDYAVIVSVGVVTTLIVVVVNFLADLLAAVADPRIRV